MANFRSAIVYSNLWVAMACTSLYLLNAPAYFQSQWYPIFLLVATAGAYNYMRLVQHKKNRQSHISGYKKWVERNLTWVAFLSAFFLGFAVYFLIKLGSLSFTLWLIIPALVSLLYPLSLRKHLSLRQVPGLKLLLISFVWAYMTVFLPTIYFSGVGAEGVFNFLWTLILVAGLTIPFDVRDMPFDAPEMRTLPILMGRVKALEIARFLLGLNQVLIVLAVLFFGWGLAKATALFVALELACFLLKKMPEGEDEFYTGFWIEGIPIFGFVVYWLLHHFIPLV